MALIKCPECGKSISSFAKCCPNCGCPIFGENNLTRLLFDFTTIPSEYFPICIETCGESYSFEFEDIATPPEYNLIEVKSIKPRFTIATYIEAAGIGNENETRSEITADAGKEHVFRIKYKEFLYNGEDLIQYLYFERIR